MNSQEGLGRNMANQIEFFIGYLFWLYNVKHCGDLSSQVDDLVENFREKEDHGDASEIGC